MEISNEQWEVEKNFPAIALEEYSEWIEPVEMANTKDGYTIIDPRGFYSREYILKDCKLLFSNIYRNAPELSWTGFDQKKFKSASFADMTNIDIKKNAKHFQWSIEIGTTDLDQMDAWKALGISPKVRNADTNEYMKKIHKDISFDPGNKLEVPFVCDIEGNPADDIAENVGIDSVANVGITMRHYGKKGSLPYQQPVSDYCRQIGSEYGRWSVRLVSVQLIDVVTYESTTQIDYSKFSVLPTGLDYMPDVGQSFRDMI